MLGRFLRVFLFQSDKSVLLLTPNEIVLIRQPQAAEMGLVNSWENAE